jgi:hypothetical protein
MHPPRPFAASKPRRWRHGLGAALLASFGCSLRSLDDLRHEEATLGLDAEPAPGSPCIIDEDCASEGANLRCREDRGVCEACPEEMRRVYLERGRAFCIDARETSRAEYAAFLSNPVAQTPDLPMVCDAKPSFVPGDGADCASRFEAEREPTLPITCVDLCDAAAYCSGVGKRLCGNPNGETLRANRRDSPDADEWFAACSGRGARRRAEGESDAGAGVCNVGSPGLEPIDARPDCTTPEGLTQMSGNVAEWANVCFQSGPLRCSVRGGEFDTLNARLAACDLPAEGVDAVPPQFLPPLARATGVGIRCCSD